VDYIQVGSLEGEILTLSDKSETVVFRLNKSDTRWVITSPVIPPHVSPRALEHYIEGLVRDEGEESRKKWAKTLNELRSLDTTNAHE
jgi:hypothetical protein